MSRSSKKGPYYDERLLAKVEKNQRRGNREPIKTWARDCTIVPEFIGQTFLVHNGKLPMRLYVTEDMIGHKLGEFAPTGVFRGPRGGRSKAKGGGDPPAGLQFASPVRRHVGPQAAAVRTAH